MALRPIRRIMVGMPVKWMVEHPTVTAVRRHCVCGTEMWIEPDNPINTPAGCYVVEQLWQCASCLHPAEFAAAMHNSGMLGYKRG